VGLARLWTTWSQAGLVVLSTISIYASVIVYTRVAGLRSLASMSSFDFAATVAIGSTIATAANLATPTAHGLLVLGLLYLLQAIIGLARRVGGTRAVDNRPLLLVADGEVLERNLRQVRVTPEELMSQLRVNGVTRLSQVRAVVMESTGTVSVLAGERPPDPEIMLGVRDGDRFRG